MNENRKDCANYAGETDGRVNCRGLLVQHCSRSCFAYRPRPAGVPEKPCKTCKRSYRDCKRRCFYYEDYKHELKRRKEEAK